MACPGGSTGTSRAALRRTRGGHFATRGSLLWTTGTSPRATRLGQDSTGDIEQSGSAFNRRRHRRRAALGKRTGRRRHSARSGIVLGFGGSACGDEYQLANPAPSPSVCGRPRWKRAESTVGYRAQATRAILLASAIVTTMRGFLAIMRASHDPAAVPRRTARRTTAIAPIISSRLRSSCPILEMRPSRTFPPEETWGEAKPGCEIASSDKRGGWRRQRLQCCRADWADTGNAHQAPRCLILAGANADPPVKRSNMLAESSYVPEKQRADLDDDAR
jgi:hypothetical protein